MLIIVIIQPCDFDMYTVEGIKLPDLNGSRMLQTECAYIDPESNNFVLVKTLLLVTVYDNPLCM